MSGNNDKLIKIRERIFKEIAKNSRDITTLREVMVKKKIVETRGKFDKVIEMLKSSGRINMTGGYVMASPNSIKNGTFVAMGKSRYILLDGDIKRYAISFEESKDYKSNQRVKVGFNEFDKNQQPFIISTIEDENHESILDSIPVEESDVILGRVAKLSHDELVFIPSDKRFTRNIMILNPKDTLSRYQDKICLLRIASNEKNGLPASGIITEIKGEAGNPIHEYEAIAENNGANMSWADGELQKEIDKIPTHVDLNDKTLVSEDEFYKQAFNENTIVDLRNLAFTTVDPATCKDMDDAIYSTYDKNGNLVAYTAVANVSKYVDLDSQIGRRYIQGGFTVYAPNRAYNILPPQLSTGICSLNPNEDRLALVIKTTINEETGKPISSTIMDAVINSHEKYSYQQAQEICDNSNITLDEIKAKINSGLTKEEQVVLNKKTADTLWKGFNERNMIQFEINDEYDVMFSEDMSEITDIKESENCYYHKVIEAFMLTANEAAAEYAKKHHIPNIYRVHDIPNESKIAQAYEFFDILKIPFDGDITPQGIEKILQNVRGKSKEKIVKNFLVRMQSCAKYSNDTNPHGKDYIKLNKEHPKKDKISDELKEIYNKSLEKMENISHFGLQSKAYSHTTSPIRRITDYVTHYNILATIHGTQIINENKTVEIAQWANVMQQANKSAENEFREVNSAIYCENHIGDVMNGIICGFKRSIDRETGKETIIALVENQEKGLKVNVPVSDILPKGIKNVRISNFGSAIVGRENKIPYVKMCDEISFKIINANRITREIKATTDLEREVNDEYETSIDINLKEISPKKLKMLKGKEYKKDYKNSKEFKDNLNEERGKKLSKEIKKRTGKQLSGKDARKEEKQSNINYKNKKIEGYKLDEYKKDMEMY